jgi:outer membrane protein assembly factor BamB
MKSTKRLAVTAILAGSLAAGVMSWLAAPRRAGAAEPAANGSIGPHDWPMWGRTNDRNMVTPEKNPPTDWDVESGKNIKWKAAVGSKSYGNPVVAGGLVFIGTNNEHHYDPKFQADGGNEIVFRESDGKYLWQHYNAKLAAGRVNDWPQEGLCSTTFVEGDRAYYCTNRCEVWCWDIEPLRRDGGPPKEIWHVDMMSQLGVFPHNMTSSSLLSYKDYIYVITGNGVDDTHKNLPAPKAPAIVCFNKNDGKPVWSSNIPGENVLHGQWSSVALTTVNGKAQIIAPLGDGWIYSFDAETGDIVWRFDSNPKTSVYPTTRNELIATPVVWENRMYIANGQDPEHGEGPGHLWCVDITKTGDISLELDDRPKPKPGEELMGNAAATLAPKPNPNSGVVWHFDRQDPTDKRPISKVPASKRMNRTISSVVIDAQKNLAFAPDFNGYLHCLDARNGKHHWTYDMEAAVWGSPMLADGKVYLCDEDGDVTIFESTAEKPNVIATHNMGSPIYCSPVFANGTLYVMNREFLFAISEKK